MKRLFFWFVSSILFAAPTARALLTPQISASVSCAKQVNFVLIHGFNGSVRTWNRWVELLHEDASLSCVNLYTFSYDTGFQEAEPSLEDLATSLRTELAKLSTTGSPLFLMAHSMGGLVVKKAFLQDLEARSFLDQTKQVFFIASPHAGVRRPVALVGGIKSAQVKELHHANLRKMRRQWSQAAETLPFVVLFSAVVGARDKLVPRYSAKGGFDDVLVLPKNHFTVKDPDSTECALYQKVKIALLASLQ